MEEIEDVGGENGGEEERHDQHAGMTATKVVAKILGCDPAEVMQSLKYSDHWWRQWLKDVNYKRKSTNFDSGDGFLAALHKDLGILLTRAPEWVIDALRDKWARIYKKMPFFIDTIRYAMSETVEVLPDPGDPRDYSLPTDKIVAHLLDIANNMDAAAESGCLNNYQSGLIVEMISLSLKTMAGDITNATKPLTEKEDKDAR